MRSRHQRPWAGSRLLWGVQAAAGGSESLRGVRATEGSSRPLWGLWAAVWGVRAALGGPGYCGGPMTLPLCSLWGAAFSVARRQDAGVHPGSCAWLPPEPPILPP